MADINKDSIIQVKSFGLRMKNMTNLQRDMVYALYITLDCNSNSFLTNTEMDSENLLKFVEHYKLLSEPTRKRFGSKMRTMESALSNIKGINVDDFFYELTPIISGPGRPHKRYGFTRSGLIYFFNSFGPNSPKADELKASYAISANLVDDLVFNLSASDFRREAFMAVMDCYLDKPHLFKSNSKKALEVFEFVLAHEPLESCKQISDRIITYVD